MLKKEVGNINITKLRVILLLEVDFNGMNKIIFNMKVIPTLEYHKSISYKLLEKEEEEEEKEDSYLHI